MALILCGGEKSRQRVEPCDDRLLVCEASSQHFEGISVNILHTVSLTYKETKQALTALCVPSSFSPFQFGRYSAASGEEAECWQVRASRLDSCQSRSECRGSLTSRGLGLWRLRRRYQSLYGEHTSVHARGGGLAPPHAPARVVALPWQPLIDPQSYAERERERKGILMKEKKKQRTMKHGGTVGEKTASVHTVAP